MRKRSTEVPTGRRRASARRPKPRRIEGGERELQGRAGESLPIHEPTFIGNEPDKHWEYHQGHKPQKESKDTDVNPPRQTSRPRQIVEIEYERGPGLKFQIEGRGGLRRRRRRQG